MHPSARARKIGDARTSILESVSLLASDIKAPDELLNRAIKPRGQGEDRFCNQLEGIAALLVEVTYAAGVRERPSAESEPITDDSSADAPRQQGRREDNEHSMSVLKDGKREGHEPITDAAVDAPGEPPVPLSKPTRKAKRAARA